MIRYGEAIQLLGHDATVVDMRVNERGIHTVELKLDDPMPLPSDG